MHDVFPKAKFRDCIEMTEKCGHTAQLRVMRKQWIEESKPRREIYEKDDVGDMDGLEVLENMEREQIGIHLTFVTDW
jgi:replication fork protection complex subunit Csm3/Swi3